MSTKSVKSRKLGTTKLDTLTVQQRMFTKYMLQSKTMDPKEAAERAGYKNPAVAANKLMKNKIIKAALGKEIHDRSQRLEMEADDVLKFLHNVLKLDITDVFDHNGHTTMSKLKSLPKEVRMCVQSIETFTKTVVDEEGEAQQVEYLRVKWMSKDHALELALKHHGLLSPDLHIHVISDQMKTQLLSEMMSQMSQANDTVIDASYIKKVANEK